MTSYAIPVEGDPFDTGSESPAPPQSVLGYDPKGAALSVLGVLPGIGPAEREAMAAAEGLGSQAARDLLPMDQASRMARAKAMGFRTKDADLLRNGSGERKYCGGGP
jgi:hypothetical protein